MTRCPIALLQCSIAAFDGLLPEPHNQLVMTTLFRLAQWHALAKLRVHTGSTLDMLRDITAELGRELRKFHDKTCATYFPQQSGGTTTARGTRKNSSEGPINLLTYKFHALGDYETTIRTFGTTDSYTTQIVRIFTVHITDHDLQLYLGRTSTPTGQTILWTDEQK
jgi:hypothetical protein